MTVPRHLRLGLFAGFVATLLLIVGAGIAREEYYLRSGQEIVLQSVPVDPVDLLRGQYVTLSYVAQSVPARCFDDNNDGQVYVRLAQDGRYWVPVECDDTRESRTSLESDNVVLKARIPPGSSQSRVEYPNTDRYYVPDGTPAPPKLPDVVLSVNGDGTARVKRLEVDGKPWP